MSSLDSLMNLEGAAAAFEYSDRGELTEHRISEQSNLTADALDLLAHVFVANICIATMQARGWEASSDAKGFYPIDSFTLVGFDWSAVTDGQLGVVVKNDGAAYQAAYDLLAQQGGGA